MLNYIELIITVLINFMFMINFLAIFFFTYIVDLENIISTNQMNFIADDLSYTIKLAGQNVYNIFKSTLNDIDITPNEQLNNSILVGNNDVLEKAITYNVIISIGIIIIISILCIIYRKDINLIIIFFRCFILLLGLAFIEYFFGTYFGSRFIEVDPNLIKYSIVKNVQEL